MNKKINLFVIGPRGFPNVQGGIEKFSENVYPLLTNNGYEITSFSLRKYFFQKKWNGINFIPVSSPGISFFEKPFYNLFSAVYCIFKRPDIIHIHSIASGMFIFLLKLFGLKIVARYNSQDYLHEKWNSFGKIILKNSEHQFFLADYIITNNKTYLEYFRSKGRKNRLSFVPNGVETNDKQKYIGQHKDLFPEKVKENKFILFVGRITSEKNIEMLIQSFLMLEDKNINLVIVGDIAHNENYFSKLKRKYSNNTIIYTGKLDREKLNCLYANCCLFVIPSFSEGMPNVLLEAMSFNCKLLASKIPAHLNFGFDAETYFDPKNATELKDKMIFKLTSAHENYDDKLLPYQWNNIVEQIHNIHLELLKIK